jgi:hypothetical protein
MLAATGGKIISLHDLGSGKLLRTFGKQNQPIEALSLSPDGKVLVSRCQSPMFSGGPALGEPPNTIRLWDPGTGRELPRPASRWEQPCGGGRSSDLAFSPDGRTFAVATAHDVALYETLTAQERLRLKGHRAGVNCLAFSGDGKVLASGSFDTTILVWEAGPSRSGDRLERDVLASHWKALAGDDAKAACRAVWALMGTSEQAVAFLEERLRPVAAVDEGKVARWLDDLGSSNYSTRKEASTSLEGVGEPAIAALRKALAKNKDLEVKRRIERILKKWDRPIPPPEQLRQLRSLEVLERSGTPRARRLLERLARGAPSRLTQEARAALDRFGKRPVAR